MGISSQFDRGHSVYERQWHLHGRHPDALISRSASINCEEYWRVHGTGAADVVVALADDGVDQRVPGLDRDGKFAAAAWLSGDRWKIGDARGSIEHAASLTGSTHGSSMAALVAGDGDERGRGVAPSCRLFPIRLPMRGGRVALTEDILMGMLDAVDGMADIALLPFSSVPVMHFSRRVLDRVEQIGAEGGRSGRGVLFVFPAGNSNCPLHYKSKTPLCYALADPGRRPVRSRTFANVFASLSCKVHVAAITASGRKAMYSNYGPGVDVCAPSSAERPFSRDKGEDLPGLVTTYRRDGAVTENFKGTSGAAALVAGFAALLRSRMPGISGPGLAALLRDNADRGLDCSDVYSVGPLRAGEDGPPGELADGSFGPAGWSPWFGHGKVDAAKFTY